MPWRKRRPDLAGGGGRMVCCDRTSKAETPVREYGCGAGYSAFLCARGGIWAGLAGLVWGGGYVDEHGSRP